MGVYSDWQPEYAERGIAVFPLDAQTRVPSIKNWSHVGVDGSNALAEKFTESDALGINLPGSALTVLDVDTSDESVLRDAMDRHGVSPFIVRSRSGHFQAYYANNGETRKTKAFPEIDLLGSGMTVAAPSKSQGQGYEIIQGDLDELIDLPTLKNLPSNLYRTKPADTAANDTPIGQRNTTLFYTLKDEEALQAGSYDQLEYRATVINRSLDVPLSEGEVIKTARQVWKYKSDGTLMVKGSESKFHVSMSVADDCLSNPDAFLLLAKIKHLHGYKKGAFKLPAATGRQIMGWGVDRYNRAKAHLVQIGQLEIVQQGKKGSRQPTIVRLP